VVSLVHQAGGGVSHAIGTGSRDLHTAVSGITTLQAIDLLREDPSTEAIVLVSKPSDPAVAATTLRALAATRKPSVAYLQGVHVEPPAGVRVARNLEEAADLALGRSPLERIPRSTSNGQVRGLYCGGTLAQEARAVLGQGHTVLDFGDDEYTRGRAHPIIDPTLRNQAIVEAGRDLRVCVVLLDFILGLGAHSDPVGAALPAIHAAMSAGRGRSLRMVAHVVGTDADPQGLARQESALREAGVEVFGSNYRAALMA
jgi:FdrA protein